MRQRTAAKLTIGSILFLFLTTISVMSGPLITPDDVFTETEERLHE